MGAALLCCAATTVWAARGGLEGRPSCTAWLQLAPLLCHPSFCAFGCCAPDTCGMPTPSVPSLLLLRSPWTFT